jgi:hypothetical protein
MIALPGEKFYEFFLFDGISQYKIFMLFILDYSYYKKFL